MSLTAITEKEVKDLVKGKLSRYFGVAPAEASKEQLYRACNIYTSDAADD